MPNQPDPNRPLFGFKYARKHEVDALAKRWGVKLTQIGTFAVNEFLAKHGDDANPPPGLIPSEDGGHE